MMPLGNASIGGVADVIFARVSAGLKGAVDAYSGQKGMTLANAVAELLARGLESSSNEDSVRNLETVVSDLRLQVAERDRQLEAERARSTWSEQRERGMQQFVQQLDQAAIAKCPQKGCDERITAIDLVVRRVCNKGHGLTPVLERASQAPGMDSGEVMLVAGGLSLLLALIAAGGRK